MFDLKTFPSLNEVTMENVIDAVIKHEGGYVNDPSDLGGETKYGITKNTAQLYRRLWEKHGFDGNMRELSYNLAFDIYRVGFWDASYCNELHDIHPLLAFHMFDCAVNMGVKHPVMHLQRLLNVFNRGGRDYPDLSVDGAIGPATIRTLARFAELRGRDGLKNIIYGLLSMQYFRYVDITEKRPENEKFTNGWINRQRMKADLFADIM